jgi:hypothetical protein
MLFLNRRVLSIALAVIGLGGEWASAQGCVAAHSYQRSFGELLSGFGQEFCKRTVCPY